jgi:hypothetical protein
VAHYPAGPYCPQCHVSLPVPAGYAYYEPAPAPTPLALPAGGRLSLEEVQAVIAETVGRLPDLPTKALPDAPPAAQEPDAAFLPVSGAVAARRAVLRAQYAQLEGQ